MDQKEKKIFETIINFQNFLNHHYGKIFTGEGMDRVNRNAADLDFSNILWRIY